MILFTHLYDIVMFYKCTIFCQDSCMFLVGIFVSSFRGNSIKRNAMHKVANSFLDTERNGPVWKAFLITNAALHVFRELK